jgi:hypothetical protein
MRKDALSGAMMRALVATISGALFVASAQADPTASQPRHPQDEAIAKGPRPYRNEEASFPSEHGQVTLAGTLSLPNGKGPFAAVLLIAAAGPEGRDEEVMGHRVFVVLADHLLRQGIAVLRYDKRGVGASTGDLSKASFDDLVSDAAIAFRYLKVHPGIDPRRAGIIGHSEGGSIGPAVAVADKDVAFIVAMAGSGLNGETRWTEQQVYAAQESGATREQQAKIRTMCQQIFQTVAMTRDDVAASARIAELIDAAVAAGVLNTERAAATRELLTPAFVRQELSDDPVSYLRKVRVPVLALVGSLDRIVPAGPYVEVMRPVLATIRGSKLQVLPGLNHVMQTAHTGAPQEFGTIEESISPVALKLIGDWVAKQVHTPEVVSGNIGNPPMRKSTMAQID